MCMVWPGPLSRTQTAASRTDIQRYKVELFMDPGIPSSWPGFELSFLHGTTRYEIQVENTSHVSRGAQTLTANGRTLNPSDGIPLADDQAKRLIRVILG